jgi:hypothetical protein
VTSIGQEGIPFQLERRTPTNPADREAISHFHQALKEGKHWYVALLEAIASWSSPEEILDGQRYLYLLANEAFDWLRLAERLCDTTNGQLPTSERDALLFHGKPPLELSPHQLQELIGSAKYRAYLNYFYGVTVEEALLLAVEEEILKERRSWVLVAKRNTTEEAYQRIYGASQHDLLTRFRKEKGLAYRRDMTIDELKEFTYWCFKYRLIHSHRARVASDTKKALALLHRLRSSGDTIPATESAAEEDDPHAVQR